MVIAAFILGVIGVSGMVVAICLGVYIAYRKPTLEVSLPSGTYRIRAVGRNKLTGVVKIGRAHV